MTIYQGLYISKKIDSGINSSSDILMGIVDVPFSLKNIYYCVTCEKSSDMLNVYTLFEYKRRKLYKEDGILTAVTVGRKEMYDFLISLTEETLNESGTADIYNYIHIRNGK